MMLQVAAPNSFEDQGAPDDCGAGEDLRHEPIDRAVFQSGPMTRYSQIAGVALALAMHLGIVLAMLSWPLEPLGSGGIDLEAISVEVDVVPAATVAGGVAASETMVPQASSADAAEASVAASASPSRSPAQTSAEPTPPEPAEAVVSDAPAPLAEAPSSKLTETPAHAPPDADAMAREPRSSSPENKVAADMPERVAARASKAAEAVAAEASPASSALHTGGKADQRQDSALAASAASPGAIKAFTRSVVEALGRSRPKGLRAGAKGTVRVEFAVGDGGSLDFVRVARSSGHTTLDEAAVGAIKRASFPSPPDGMDIAQRTYEVPYHFR